MREGMPVSRTDGDGLSLHLDECLLSVVEKYCSSGIIPLKDIEDETALRLEFLRLAVPIKGDSLAWISRQFGSDMEIPYAVRYYFKFGRDWRRAIEEYFRAIGESNAWEFVEIFKEIVERSKNLIVCGEDIVDIAVRHKREPGTLISELKGSGLISPTVGCGGIGRARAPLYEINRFFAILLKIEC